MVDKVDRTGKLLLNRRAFLSKSAVGGLGLLLAPQRAMAHRHGAAEDFAPGALRTVRWSQITIPLQGADKMREMLVDALARLLYFTQDRLPETASSIGSFPGSAAQGTHQGCGFAAQLSYRSGHTVVLAAGRGLSQEGETIIRGDQETRRIVSTTSWGGQRYGDRRVEIAIERAREYSQIALTLAAHAAQQGATLSLHAEIR